MKEKNYHIILILGLIITIIGIMTNKFIFLLLLFPFGLKVFQDESRDD